MPSIDRQYSAIRNPILLAKTLRMIPLPSLCLTAGGAICVRRVPRSLAITWCPILGTQDGQTRRQHLCSSVGSIKLRAGSKHPDLPLRPVTVVWVKGLFASTSNKTGGQRARDLLVYSR